MKVELKEGYIAIIAPTAMRWASLIMSGRPDGRAWALFPGIIVFRDESEMVPWVINHERIHFRQALNLLIVGVWIFWILERIWIVVVEHKSFADAYLWDSFEQEAYRNQQNFEYLKNRKPFAQFWYLTHKREFIFGEPGEIIYIDKK